MGAPNSRMQPTALRALTDWDSDVDELIALYENPDAFTNDGRVVSATTPNKSLTGAAGASKQG